MKDSRLETLTLIAGIVYCIAVVIWQVTYD